MKTKFPTRPAAASLGLLLVAALLALVLPAGAAAQADPLDGEATTLALKKKVAKALAAGGIKVKPTKPATASKKGVAFPITGGELDPDTAQGTINHSGGLKFKAGKRKIAIEDFTIKVAEKAKLTAVAGDTRFKAFDLNLEKAKIERNGAETKISKVKAELTRGAAKALNGALGTKAFAKGLVVGKATVVAVSDTVLVREEGNTSLALDPGAAAALASEGITPGLIAPATANTDGSFAFPITGGRVDPESLAGNVAHSGGISLTEGSTTVELTEFDIQIDDAPDLTALVGGNRVSILDLDLTNATITPGDGGGVTVSGVQARLTAAAADALNAAFATTAFTPGLLIGEATVNAVVR